MMRKNTFKQFPVALLTRALCLWLCGRVHFPKNRVGQVVKEDEDFVIFRQAVVEPSAKELQRSGAILRVRFHFRRFSLTLNRILSLIPIPFIVAQPGFRSKVWMFGKETRAFQGLYAWDTVEDAQNYAGSFPLRLMKKRALPESLVFEIRET